MITSQNLVNNSSDAAIVIDGNQLIVACNEAAEALLGLPAARILGQPCYRVLSGLMANGRPLCSPNCAAIACFRQGIPFGGQVLLYEDGAGNQHHLTVSSIVLSGEVESDPAQALLFFRPSPLGALAPRKVPFLEVYTLGPFRLRCQGEEMAWQRWSRRHAITLLKILLTRRGHAVHREELIEHLWPESSVTEGLARLKVLVHSLRRALEPELQAGVLSRFITTRGECYLFTASDEVWIDAEAFRAASERGDRRAQRGDVSGALEEYERAAEVYRGDYLEEDRYADWCELERQWLRERYLSFLLKMAALCAAHQDLEQAIVIAQRAVSLEPVREASHRALMSYLWAAGRNGEALQQYHLCRQALAAELQIAPSPETRSLYEQIQKGAAGAA